MRSIAELGVLRERGARLAAVRGRARVTDEPNTSAIFPAVVGVLVLIASETMLFAGLLSAYVILRAGALAWPPAGQPWLPAGVTAVNSLFLFGSGYTMYRAVSETRFGARSGALPWLVATMALGLTFLAVQGTEWVHLVRFGLTLRSSLYGALFYTLVGAHGLHVVAAVIALLVVSYRLAMPKKRVLNHAGVVPLSLYWWFVVALWPVIYVTVYLG